MTALLRFQHTGLILVRATTDPGDLDVPAQLDLSDPDAVTGDGIVWLAKTWTRPDVRHALCIANPALADRLDQFLNATTLGDVKDIRRAVMSVASYVLRWQRRPTPFGLFAGIATAAVGPASAAIGHRHQAVARVDAEWLAAVIVRLEQHPQLRADLHVVADNTAVVRDGRCIVARRADLGGGTAAVPLREASVRWTRPVQHALDGAVAPIRLDALATDLAARFPVASLQQVLAVLDGLVDQGFLITSLRPPMTVVDGLTHVIDAATAAGGDQLADVAQSLHDLTVLREVLDQHNTTIDATQAAALRQSAAEQMKKLVPAARQTVAVDTRLDAQIEVPPQDRTPGFHAARAIVGR